MVAPGPLQGEGPGLFCSAQTCGSRQSLPEPWVTWAFPPPGLGWSVPHSTHPPQLEGRPITGCPAWRHGPAGVGAEALPKCGP